MCPVCAGFFVPERDGQKYCSSRCRERARPKRKGDRHKENRNKPNAFDRRFCAWDGEGYDGKYVLLANSEGQSISDPDGLSTRDCLEFLLSAPRTRNHVWFAFGYDVNMILHDVPLTGEAHSLEELYRTGQTTWHGYRIQYTPRKSFTVSKGRGHERRSFHSHDVFGFFQGKFTKVCREWLGEVPSLIEEGKEQRADFASWSLDKIRDYNALECALLVRIMDRFRDALRAAGLSVRRWDGAGAVAAVWLEKHAVDKYYGEIPREMVEPVACAYFGGRIELAAWGASRVYHYDINSAYPAALCECPDMSRLRWRLTRPRECPAQKFALVHVRWRLRQSDHSGVGQWNPFPWRSKQGGIYYPYEGEGWYWAVEVQAALRRFGAGDWLEIIEAWEPEGEIIYPLREPIERDYAHRAALKAAGDPANVPIKLALNSLYGKTAQKHGYGGKPPKWRNLAWAGYITAATRARLSDALAAARGRVICVMTDGVWSEVPLDLPLSKKLGEWSYEEHDARAEFCGAGLYRAFDADGKATEYKQRGFGGAQIDYAGLIAKWEGKRDAQKTQDVFILRRFVGMGLAIISVNKYRDKWLTFADFEKRIKPVSIEGTTKRLPDLLGGTKRGNLHWQVPRDRPEAVCSYPYKPGLAEENLDEEERVERLAEECAE